MPDQVIQRISGPISMYYLRPDPSFMKDYLAVGIYLPLVMLWGDQHESVSGQCDSCECGEEECCRAIYDASFVKSLDQLGKEYPIDFYTEWNGSRDPSITTRYKDNILFYHFLTRLTLPCHNVSLRSKENYHSLCPTRNIRWHYSDVRFEQNTIEGNILEPFRYFLQNTMPYFYHFPLKVNSPKKLLDHLERVSQTLFPVPAPDRVPYTSKKDRDALKQNGQIIRNEMIRILFQWTGSPTSKWKSILVKYKTLLKIHLIYLKSDSHSVIFKQIRKMPTPHFESIDHLVDLIFPTYFQTHKKVFADWENELSKHASIVLEMIRIFLSGEASDANGYSAFRNNTTKLKHVEIALDNGLEDKWKFLLHKMSSMFLFMDSYLVEFYTVMRMIKPPQGSNSPVLALGFYGNAHTRSMVEWLLGPLFGYQLVFGTGDRDIHDNQPNFRCLSVTTPIYLEKDMRDHAQTQGNHNHHYKPYQNVLERERSSRKANRNRILQEEIQKHEGDLMAMENPFSGGRRKIGGRRKTRRKHL